MNNNEKPIGHYITKVESEAGYVGIAWDVVTMTDGKIICVTDECITAWKDRAEFDRFLMGQFGFEEGEARTLDICELKDLTILPEKDWTEHSEQI